MSIRSERFAPEMRDAASEMTATGRKMRREMSHPPASPTRSTPAPVPASCQVNAARSAVAFDAGRPTRITVAFGPCVTSSRFEPLKATVARSPWCSRKAVPSGNSDALRVVPSARQTAK